MSGSGSFAVSRSLGGEDSFYKLAPMRKYPRMAFQQQQQQQQQQLQRAAKSDSSAQVPLPESDFRTESDDSVMVLLSQPTSVCSSSPTKPPLTNLDSFLESVTPSVAVRHFSEVKEMEYRTREAESSPFYFLGDLWDTFSEWSAYGVGVQLSLNGEETIKQYYVPYLSGIQLYVDPLKHRPLFRQSNQDSDPDSFMETSRGSSVYLPDKRLKSLADGSANQHNYVISSEQLNRHLQTGRSAKSSSSHEAENGNSPGQLVFEYFELEQPHNRRAINDKISVLASQFPELRKYRSCDLLPSSWISVAWYPIYRIPMGSTLRDLDASFLTFHYLSTHSRCKSQMQVNGVGVRNGLGSVDLNSKISLPVFGLATYKLKGSILTPCGPLESDKENSLLQAAESWLQQLEVVLPDYQFFRAQYSRLK